MLNTPENRDTRGLVVIVPQDVHRQLRIAAADRDMSLQKLALEALIEFLERREIEAGLAVK